MRRAGKTSFLHQCRSDLLAAGRSANRLIYFNFEDERLGGLAASLRHLAAHCHGDERPDCPILDDLARNKE